MSPFCTVVLVFRWTTFSKKLVSFDLVICTEVTSFMLQLIVAYRQEINSAINSGSVFLLLWFGDKSYTFSFLLVLGMTIYEDNVQ
jgi:hypothetical protein